MLDIRSIKFVIGILKYHLTKRRFPLLVVLSVTNRCNLRCIYCFGQYGEREVNDFATEELLNIIDELSQMGTKIVSISGGEPLLRDDIGEIIKAVKRKKMICLMNTNGLLIERHFASLRELDTICIGFDGNEVENDLNRGKGSFKRIIEGIKIAKELNIPVHTVCVITKNNINCVEYIINLAKEMGFSVEFNFPCGLLSEISSDYYIGKNEDYQNAILKIIEYKKNSNPILFSKKSYEFVLAWLKRFDRPIFFDFVPKNLNYVPCYSGKLECFIDADGFLYPCYQLIGRYPTKNIKEIGFRKAWEELDRDIDCKACFSLCSVEHNYIFNLAPAVIFNSVKNVILRK